MSGMRYYVGKHTNYCVYCKFPIDDHFMYIGKEIRVSRQCPNCKQINEYPTLHFVDRFLLRIGFYTNPFYLPTPEWFVFLFFFLIPIWYGGVFVSFVVLNLLGWPIVVFLNNIAIHQSIRRYKQTIYKKYTEPQANIKSQSNEPVKEIKTTQHSKEDKPKKLVPPSYIKVQEKTNAIPNAVHKEGVLLAGSDHAVYLAPNQQFYIWGNSFSGALGIGDNADDKAQPIKLSPEYDFLKYQRISLLAVGGTHTGILTTDHRLFLWGNNNEGQLGTGDKENQVYPVEITKEVPLLSQETIVALSFGSWYSALLTSHGRLFAWGVYSLEEKNDLCQLTPRCINELLPLIKNERINQISFSQGNRSMVLTSKGRLLSWSYALPSNDSQIENEVEIIPLPAAEEIVDFSSGGYHFAILTKQGHVYTSGWNYKASLGNGKVNNDMTSELIDITHNFALKNNEKITSLYCGGHHSGVLTSLNRVLMWGAAIANGQKEDAAIPIDITPLFKLKEGERVFKLALTDHGSMALTSQQRIFMWGDGFASKFDNLGANANFVPKDKTRHFK
jgi:alpha-tubulin suppressor-like RCC1 family protein